GPFGQANHDMGEAGEKSGVMKLTDRWNAAELYGGADPQIGAVDEERPPQLETGTGLRWRGGSRTGWRSGRGRRAGGHATGEYAERESRGKFIQLHRVLRIIARGGPEGLPRCDGSWFIRWAWNPARRR